jgi:hypothetical protein
VFNSRYCMCDDGYTHWAGKCDYLMKPQVCTLLLSVVLLTSV